jgi:hypothetical protein
MTNTIVTNEKAALELNGNVSAQNGLQSDGLVYCTEHGVVNSWHGQCLECVDTGWLDFDATRIAKELIPDWTGIKTDGRQVIVTRVRDALDAVQAISRYKHSNALVLIAWGSVITALDNGRIGPNWTLRDVSEYGPRR